MRILFRLLLSFASIVTLDILGYQLLCEVSHNNATLVLWGTPMYFVVIVTIFVYMLKWVFKKKK